MNIRLLAITVFALSPGVLADDVAGQAKSAPCTACHGANGVSVSDNIPNLAGQKVTYITNQLNAFKDNKRVNPLMNAIAGQLSDTDIDDLAGFFSNLPVATESVTGEMTETLKIGKVAFPDDYLDDYVLYATSNRADNKQVRYTYANAVAVQGAKAGGELPSGSKIMMEVYKAKLDADNNPVMGDDGFYEKDTLAGYGVMEKQSGWGDDIPEILRNADWNYAFFTPEKEYKEGINQAACLACHKPLVDDFYLFSAKQIREVAAK